ncbi:uncharacterized protein LOC133365308 isoform X2 [Rhineura floridana]|nr:uncharacterized protein LOC133365308 isoform X2 [Rhineura floridana]
MPRQSRKVARSACTPPPHTPVKGSSCSPLNGTSSLDYSVLKRTQLQHQCKKLGLRATGKNAELVERLKAYHRDPQLKAASSEEEETSITKERLHNPGAPPTVLSHLDLAKDVKTELTEEKTDIVYGWCVVHGMALYRPPSSWAPLLLRGGLVCVQDGKNIVPFHLPPLKIPVPDGFFDNYVCEDCVIRNREKPKRCLLCQQIQGKGNQDSLSQNFLKSQIPLQESMSRPSLHAAGVSNDRRRTFEIKKLYQPQEDQAYAQQVDGILSQMARGQLGMDRAFYPLQPLVVHSPAPFER